MNKISVIIPYFQRDPGILTRAANSIKSQRIPEGWSVDVIVIDDASPRPAHSEVNEADFTAPLRLTVIRQANGGVAVARNRGLQEADQSSRLFAFLDSDDIWPADHLTRAIEAIEQGFDFYFTDNRRVGRYESYCRLSLHTAKTAGFIATSEQKSGYLEIPKELMIGLTLGEFPCQASTVVYRRSIASDLRFDAELEHTGEDVLFFTTLAASANRICFDLDSIVECGSGVNIYFSNLTTDGERFLPIKVDKFVTHIRIAQQVDLSERNRNWNDDWLGQSRRDLAYHLLRSLPTKPAPTIREINRLTRMAPRAAIEIPREMLHLVLGRLARTLGRGSKDAREDVK